MAGDDKHTHARVHVSPSRNMVSRTRPFQKLLLYLLLADGPISIRDTQCLSSRLPVWLHLSSCSRPSIYLSATLPVCHTFLPWIQTTSFFFYSFYFFFPPPLTVMLSEFLLPSPVGDRCSVQILVQVLVLVLADQPPHLKMSSSVLIKKTQSQPALILPGQFKTEPTGSSIWQEPQLIYYCAQKNQIIFIELSEPLCVLTRPLLHSMEATANNSHKIKNFQTADWIMCRCF